MKKLEKAIKHIEYLESVLACIDAEVFLVEAGREEAEEAIQEIHRLVEEASDIDWEREND